MPGMVWAAAAYDDVDQAAISRTPLARKRQGGSSGLADKTKAFCCGVERPVAVRH